MDDNDGNDENDDCVERVDGGDRDVTEADGEYRDDLRDAARDELEEEGVDGRLFDDAVTTLFRGGLLLVDD